MWMLLYQKYIKVPCKKFCYIHVVFLINSITNQNGLFNASYFMEGLSKKKNNIRFSESGASHKNGTAERAKNKVVTMESVRFMHAALRCTKYTFSTDLCTMVMEYDVCIYDWIPVIQYGLSIIEIYSISMFEILPENPSNCYVWGFPEYVLETNMQKPGVKSLSGIPGFK